MARLPGLGPRSARRAVLAMIRRRAQLLDAQRPGDVVEVAEQIPLRYQRLWQELKIGRASCRERV